MISPPIDEDELKRMKDIKTGGKFIEVKFNIKNNRKESLTFPVAHFVDQEKRKFSPFWKGRYWVLEEEQLEGDILPNVEKRFAEIFEVPKDAELIKLKIKFSKILIDAI